MSISKISMFMYMLSFLMFNLSMYSVNFSLSWMISIPLMKLKQFILISFLFDWVSLLYGSMVIFISATIFLYSMDYMKGHYWLDQFNILVSMFIFSMILLITSSNLLTIILGWDLLGLTSFFLVLFFQNQKSYKASVITILSNRVGDVMIISSMFILLSYFNWDVSNLSLSFYSNQLMFLIFVASSTKSAQVPFSAWLPEAMAAPTPVSALVHSSTLVTAGVFLLIRFYSFLCNSMFMKYFLMLISMITILISGISALLECDLKKIVALSTMSQLGLMVYSLTMLNWKIVYFHMMIHAFFKASMFLSAGSILHSTKTQDVRVNSSILSFSPLSSLGLLLATLCLSGFPFMNGFFSKELIYQNSLVMSKNFVILIIFIMTIILTMIYSMKFMKIIIFNNPSTYNFNSFSEPFFMKLSSSILIISSISMGSVFQWMLLINNNFINILYQIFPILSFIILIYYTLKLLMSYKLFPQLPLKFYVMNMLFIKNLTHYNFVTYLVLDSLKVNSNWEEEILTKYLEKPKFIPSMYNIWEKEFLMMSFFFTLMLILLISFVL